jgi:hypothetical protein
VAVAKTSDSSWQPRRASQGLLEGDAANSLLFLAQE